MFLGLIDVANQWVVLVILLWSIMWKGFALWVSARRGETWWFVALLVLNTAGILEIVYLFWYTKRRVPAGKSSAGSAKRGAPDPLSISSAQQPSKKQSSENSLYKDNRKEQSSVMAEEDTGRESPEHA